MLIDYSLPDGRTVQINSDVTGIPGFPGFKPVITFELEAVAPAIRGVIVNATYKPLMVVCCDCGAQYDGQMLPSHECRQQRAANRRRVVSRG